MTLQVLTPIYPPDIKPVRDGLYLAKTDVWRLTRWYGDVGGYWATTDVIRKWRGLAFCPYSAIATTHTDISIASQRVYEIEGVILPGASCC